MKLRGAGIVWRMGELLYAADDDEFDRDSLSLCDEMTAVHIDNRPHPSMPANGTKLLL